MRNTENISAPSALQSTLLAGRARRILVIDDEPLIGRFIGNALAREVVEAFECPALALARTHEVPFDLILCDLVMPRMTGLDFYQALREQRPELTSRFTLMTGSPFGAAIVAFLDSEPVRLLSKPFGVLELTRCLPPLPPHDPEPRSAAETGRL